MLIVVAPASTAMRTISTRKSRSERVASSGENSTSSHSERASRTDSPHWSSASARLIFSLYSRCRSLDARKTWMRARSANCSARAAISMSSVLARASDAMRGLRIGLRDRRDGGKVALRSHGEAGLDDVHAQILQGVGHGELFLRGHAAARRLLAVAQGGVEENYVICCSCDAPAGETDLVQLFYCRRFGRYKAKLLLF